MKSTSKVVMGAIVVMVVCLALVLCLILVLLAELYCSLLLHRRRQLRMGPSASSSASANTSPTTNTMPLHHLESEIISSPSTLPPLHSYYSHGVLQAPRNILFPVVSSYKNSMVAKARNQLSQFHHAIEIEVDTREEVGNVATSPPVDGGNACDQSACTGCGEHLVYISNPIYDDDANRVVDNNNANTPPFETPHSSPSCLEICRSSSSEEEEKDEEEEEEEEEEKMAKPSSSTPPLTPMKKLPTGACSVSLRDARSLGTSGSDSVNNDISSSSSASPSTSPSW